ncbi:MAG: hypothetical protein IH596_07880 [Bacteroidales bacterium]|nr:hypothetical protein [Bacteroidales bacterium]
MKKLTYFSIACILIVASIFSGCKKDDTNPPDQKEFAFSLIAAAGYTSGDVTLTTGEQFKVGFNATAATGFTLSNLKVTRIYNEKPDDIFDTTLNLTALNYIFYGISLHEAGVENWIFTITQSDGNTLVSSFNITTETMVGPIFTYNQRILGAQINIIGSSFASSNGEIYNLANAKINAAMIDWLYYYGSTNLATIASPDDADAATVFTDGGTVSTPGPNALVNWSVRNSTRFRIIMDAIDWDAIQDDTELINLTQGATDPMAGDLKPGYFIAFVTVNGKKGLIRVNNIFQEEDGTVDISVKVQQ